MNFDYKFDWKFDWKFDYKFDWKFYQDSWFSQILFSDALNVPDSLS